MLELAENVRDGLESTIRQYGVREPRTLRTSIFMPAQKGVTYVSTVLNRTSYLQSCNSKLVFVRRSRLKMPVVRTNIFRRIRCLNSFMDRVWAKRLLLFRRRHRF